MCNSRRSDAALRRDRRGGEGNAPAVAAAVARRSEERWAGFPQIPPDNQTVVATLFV